MADRPGRGPSYADTMAKMFEAQIAAADDKAHEMQTYMKVEQERLSDEIRQNRTPEAVTEAKEVKLFGTKVLLGASYFKNRADVVMLSMLTMGNNPEMERIFELSGFTVIDTEGKQVFPRSALQRLADVAEE